MNEKSNMSPDNDDIALLPLPDQNIERFETEKSDEEIISSSNYDFAKDIDKLIMNSNETRRAEKFENGEISDPPRPLNSFFIYMKVMRNRIIKTSNKSHSMNISKKIGKSWSEEPKNVKEFFRICARLAKKEHGRIYKSYQYKKRIPQKRLINHSEEDAEAPVESDQDNLPHLQNTCDDYDDAQLSTVIAPICNLSIVNEFDQLNQIPGL
jgi:hypothetical protein